MAMIVVLDGRTANPGDLSWEPLEFVGMTEVFPYTPPDRVIERAANAEILVINKVQLTREVLDQLPKLKCICLLATGYDNVDISAAAERGIPVCNVRQYSTKSVAQHVFALLLALTSRAEQHSESVTAGQWSSGTDFSYTLLPLQELAGQTMGIFGFGHIGQAVGEIAHVFGMQVIAVHRHPERDVRPWVRFVNHETLFRESDVLSLHAPLNETTRHIVNQQHLKLMKSNALLINTARGGLVDEAALAKALHARRIAGAGLDVLSQEPPPPDHVLIGLANCIVTPHIAWASTAARKELIRETGMNIEAFLKGQIRNQVN